MSDTQSAGTPAADAGVTQPVGHGRVGWADAARRHEWAAALRYAGRRERERQFPLNGVALDRLADQVDSGALTPWADTPEPSTSPAQPHAERRAAVGGHPGTLDGPGVLGRALQDADGDLWQPFPADSLSGEWWRHPAVGEWRRGRIDRKLGPVQEVLLVDPALIDLLRQWRNGYVDGDGLEYTEVRRDLAAAVDAYDRPTTGDDPLAEGFKAVAEHGRQQARMLGAILGANGGASQAGLSDAEVDAEIDAAAERVGTESAVEQYTSLTVPDSPKMLRETLGVAQVAVNNWGSPRLRDDHVARLQRLINECDRHRPLGPDGKHGDQHTPTCGCAPDATIEPRRAAGLEPCREDLSRRRPAEPAPEPAGDGPGWDRVEIGEIGKVVHGVGVNLAPEKAGQVIALLADRDEQRHLLNTERVIAGKYRQAAHDAIAKRDAARAELAEARRQLAATERTRDEIARTATAAQRRLAEVKVERDRLRGDLNSEIDRQAEIDRLRAELAEVERERVRWTSDAAGWERHADELAAELATARRDAVAERRDIVNAAERREAVISQHRWHMESCIWIDPGRMSGQPCLGGSRLNVDLIAGLMGDGMDGDQIRGLYPDVTDEHLAAVRHFQQWLAQERVDAMGDMEARERHAAADALEHAAAWINEPVLSPLLRRRATEVRDGTRPVPGSPEPAPADQPPQVVRDKDGLPVPGPQVYTGDQWVQTVQVTMDPGEGDGS